MFFTWEICHDTGERKGFLFDRQDGEVTVGLNDQRTCSVSANLEDTVSNLIRPGRTRMKVRCNVRTGLADNFLLVNNLIQNPVSSGAYVEIPAVCPSIRLLNASHASYPTDGLVPADWDPTDLDKSELMWELIFRSDKRRRERQADLDAIPDPTVIPPVGIIQGTLASAGTVEPRRFADGQITWDELKRYADLAGWPDFELNPLDNIGDYEVAEFNTFLPSQGTDRTKSVILEYGNNLSADPDGFQYEPSGVDLCNRVAFIGRNRRGFVAEDTISINRYGIWQGHDQQINTKDMDKLEEMAKSYVAKHCFHINFVNVVPAVEQGGTARGWHRDALGNWTSLGAQEYAVPPVFAPTDQGGDYWLGDEITIRAKDQFTIDVEADQAGPDTDFRARVTAGTFREVDEAGNVGVALTLVPVVDDDPNVGGYETIIRANNG